MGAEPVAAAQGWAQPALIAAIVSGVIALLGVIAQVLTSLSLHGKRTRFEERLAERKFDFDRALAKQKVDLELVAADRKKKQDLAEEVLADFLDVQRMLPAVRSPFSYTDEGKGRPRSPEEDSEGRLARTKDSYYVIIARLDKHRALIARLMSRQYRMVAWFGVLADAPFERLNRLLVRVSNAAHMLISTTDGGIADSDNQGIRKEWLDLIWAQSSTGDAVQQEMDEIVRTMEAICRPILSTPEVEPLQT